MRRRQLASGNIVGRPYDGYIVEMNEPAPSRTHPMLTALPPQPTSLRKHVEEILRRAIVAGELAPGQHLVDRVLCDSMNVSRTVIREAQRSLETEGLVVIHTNRGCFVRSVTANDAAYIYEVRAALEPLAGQAFALRAADAEIEELRKVFDEFRHVAKTADKARLGEIKDRFYAVLLRGGKNPFVGKMMQLVLNQVGQYRSTSMSSPGRLPETLKEMQEIVHAVSRRDAKAAWKACLKHVREAEKAALQVIEKQAA
jgi:DNA-binding GntR family transcriptional regulator